GEYLQLVAAYCGIGRYDDGERVLRQSVLTRWPNSANAAYYEGFIQLHHSGEAASRQALASFERCLKFNPKHASGKYRHAVCLSKLGREAEAEVEFRALLTIPSQELGAYQGLAASLRKQGKLDEARQAMATFEKMESAHQRVRYLMSRVSFKKSTPAD